MRARIVKINHDSVTIEIERQLIFDAHYLIERSDLSLKPGSLCDIQFVRADNGISVKIKDSDDARVI